MIITRLELIDKEKQLVRVYFDNNKAVDIDKEIVYLSNLKKGRELTHDELITVIKEQRFKLAYKKAVRLLSIKNYSSSKLYKKLLEDHKEEVCAMVIAHLEKSGYLNDLEYAKRLAEQSFTQKKWGESRVRNYLFSKEFSKEVIEEALGSIDLDTSSNIIELINKKYKGYNADYRLKQKMIAGLMRYGYSYSQISTAIDKSKE